MAQTSAGSEQRDNRYVPEPGFLSCTCCGEPIRDCPEENVAYGILPRPYDTGYGMCKECGGDPDSKSFPRRLGWAGRTFYEARFEILRNSLDPANRAKFDQLTYERKVIVIAGLIEQGAMI